MISYTGNTNYPAALSIPSMLSGGTSHRIGAMTAPGSLPVCDLSPDGGGPFAQNEPLPVTTNPKPYMVGYPDRPDDLQRPLNRPGAPGVDDVDAPAGPWDEAPVGADGEDLWVTSPNGQET